MKKIIIAIIVIIGAYSLAANGAAKSTKPVESAVKARSAVLASI